MKQRAWVGCRAIYTHSRQSINSQEDRSYTSQAVKHSLTLHHFSLINTGFCYIPREAGLSSRTPATSTSQNMHANLGPNQTQQFHISNSIILIKISQVEVITYEVLILLSMTALAKNRPVLIHYTGSTSNTKT